MPFKDEKYLLDHVRYRVYKNKTSLLKCLGCNKTLRLTHSPHDYERRQKFAALHAVCKISK